MARRLSRLSALFGRGRAASPETPLSDPFAGFEPQPIEADAVDQALDEIEQGALSVYAAAGLPTRLGHYRRDPQDGRWAFVAARLTPEERFQLALDHPPEDGWRFARLQDLGLRETREDVRRAARLLNDIADLRAARHGPLTREHLLVALELGGAWRALRDAQAIRDSRLTLTPAAPPKARRTRDKRGGSH
ncbi:hypothetical protein [Brevundimonas sp. SORGH_AS_0993]|uniref:hypothetical protein n=1 Tax=Brevundimonas sp. SORGH_AS_0993 TaxID=3041794 RepID=UPI0027815843|nr:hypothetical protein [Brevundimonas sp. SORGH_AS_0993]MDQ1154652.1 hypothetical protein [Brevundimonas sp. SORGH_AS_0993]